MTAKKSSALLTAIAVTIIFTFTFSINVDVFAKSSDSMNTLFAIATPQTVYVDGIPSVIRGYNIEGSNYFLISELAEVLSGTEAQFDFTLNPTQSEVEITTGVPYSNSMPSGEYHYSSEALPLTSIVKIAEQHLEFNAYRISGNNYYKLRDIAPVLGCDIWYDESSNSVYIISDPYEYTPLRSTFNVDLERVIEEDELSQYLYRQISMYSTIIDIERFKISSSDITQVFFAFLNRHPELFYIQRTFTYKWFDDNNYITYLSIEYTADTHDINLQRDAFWAELERAYSEIPVLDDPREQILAVNTWLCKHSVYDDSLTFNNAYNLLVDRTGTCEAYTAIFNIMMTHFGIPWRKLSSDIMDHTWNQVMLDGQWLHVDVTWNDNYFDETGLDDNTFLLLDDKQISVGDNPHYNWIVETEWVA